MRKAVSVSALVAMMAAGSVRAEDAVKALVSPDAQIVNNEAEHAQAMQDLSRRINDQAQSHIARSLAIRGMAMPRVYMDFVQFDGGPGRMYAPGGVQTEKAAYMGVGTAEVPEVLRDQLKIHRGMGLVVQYLEKGSPAEEAGVKRNDVIEKLDDQWIVNGQQLAVLVRNKKPGDEVTLGLIRGGERLAVKVKLVEKELPVLEDGGSRFFSAPGAEFRSFPSRPGGFGGEQGGTWDYRTRKTIVKNKDGSITRHMLDGNHDITVTTASDGKTTVLVKDVSSGKEIYNGPYNSDEDRAKIPEDLAKKVRDLTKGVDGPGEGKLTAAEVTRADSDYRITLKRDGDGRHATVRDLKADKVIYDGPADSEEDFKKMPDGVAEKVKALEEKVELTK